MSSSEEQQKDSSEATQEGSQTASRTPRQMVDDIIFRNRRSSDSGGEEAAQAAAELERLQLQEGEQRRYMAVLQVLSSQGSIFIQPTFQQYGTPPSRALQASHLNPFIAGPKSLQEINRTPFTH